MTPLAGGFEVYSCCVYLRVIVQLTIHQITQPKMHGVSLDLSMHALTDELEQVKLKL